MLYPFSVHQLKLPQGTSMSNIKPLDVMPDPVPTFRQVKFIYGALERSQDFELLVANTYFSKLSLDAKCGRGKRYKFGRQECRCP
jgi:hypothetical protein